MAGQGTWWLLHAVGYSDFGVPVDKESRRVLAERIAALEAMADPSAALRDLAWEGDVSGKMSPLGFAARSIPAGAAVRLVLVATDFTRQIADTLARALTKAPAAYGTVFASVQVATSVGAPGSGGLAEKDVAAAVGQVLSCGDGDQVMMTWGSGATQVSLGTLDVVITSGVPWRLANVGETLPSSAYHVFNPTEGIAIDPRIPLLERWHAHEHLKSLITESTPADVRERVEENVRRWERAHLDPAAADLRSVAAAALARGDATSAIAVRRYILAHYDELRGDTLDLHEWAKTKLGGAPALGPVLREIHSQSSKSSGSPELRKALDSPGGRWLSSPAAEHLNNMGARSSHELAVPKRKEIKQLRRHLAEFDSTQVLPATSAWFIGIAGTGTADPQRPALLTSIAAHYAAGGQDKDDPLCVYLNLEHRDDLGLRFLVLGTEPGNTDDKPGSLGNAVSLAESLNAQLGSAVAASAPIPDASFDADAAYRLLSEQFAGIADEIGEIVLAPTGRKSDVMPLIVAGHRLAMEHGIPFHLRQLANDGGTHRLPLRFGTDLNLLEAAGHALSTMELDTAARLLEATSLRQDVAGKIRGLTTALCLRHLDANWPSELPTEWSRADKTTGLIAQRVDVWANLAANGGPAHTVRAIVSACGVIEHSVKKNLGGKAGEALWTREQQRMRTGPARALGALFTVRNKLAISHGDNVPDVKALDVLATKALGGKAPLTPLKLLQLAAVAARAHWPAPRDAHRHPTLRDLHAAITTTIEQTALQEMSRLTTSATHLATGN